MPPESLFLHSLHCPSPIAEDVRSLLDALHYPKTLKSEPQLIEQNNFAAPLSDPHSELCLPLDDYVDFGSNFFYQDCPGAVSSLGEDAGKRTFLLPGVLSVECANFASGMDGVTSDSFRLLPSELWIVKCEIGQWSDFPNAYSYTVLRALLCMELAKERDILTWVIANSPRFGVIIDPPMRDHIFVLLRLCVMAIVKEAHCSYEPLLKGNSENSGGHLNPKTMSFRCPALVDVLSWLATQLSVLYGEANAKQFTIGMLKQLLQNVACSSLVYPLHQNLDKVLDNEQGLMSSTGNLRADQSSGQVGQIKGGGIVNGAIFVYQVAVAIAALHERSVLEDKIKALRSYPYMTAYQRVVEHGYLSKKAQDEREKHPNYRPLVDHDGLPVQCQHDKDMADRNKTKEQLLAEERDYKRRRMSYRGKKAKRNVKEVMRDIIDEHMEAIMEAGGIGCFDQGVKDGSVSTSKPLAQDYGKHIEFKRSTSYEYEASRNHHNVYNNNLNSDYKSQIQTMDPSEHARAQKVISRSRHRDDSNHRNPGRERNQEDSRYQRNGRRKESDRHDSYSRSHRERSYRSLGDQKSDWKKETEEDDSYPRKYGQSRNQRSDRKLEREEGASYHRSSSTEKHERSTDQRSSWRNETEKEIYKSRSTLASGRKDKRRFEDDDRGRRKRVRNDRSDSIAGSEFDDRYAPSRSPEM